MPSGTGHFTGSSKRVEAHPKSSNLVVNSVALSRDLPVFTGFFEIIRVVHENGNMSKGLIDNSLLTEQGDTIIVSEKSLEREFLILETVGYNLYECIKNMAEKRNNNYS